jgi:hypothetical protein
VAMIGLRSVRSAISVVSQCGSLLPCGMAVLTLGSPRVKFLRTVEDLATFKVRGCYEGGQLSACRGGFRLWAVWRDGIRLEDLVALSSLASNRMGVLAVLVMILVRFLTRIKTLRAMSIYKQRMMKIWVMPELIDLLCDGGDQGDLGERSTHPKPSGDLSNSDMTKAGSSLGKQNQTGLQKMKEVLEPIQGLDGSTRKDEKQDWIVDVYHGQASGSKRMEEDDDMLEIDLEEEGAEALSNCMAIAVYYSRKSYNPKVLLSDMLVAWNIEKLAKLEKIDDYIFRVEFMTLEEKNRVIEGGPWRHKGDAFIVTHYDGSV